MEEVNILLHYRVLLCIQVRYISNKEKEQSPPTHIPSLSPLQGSLPDFQMPARHFFEAYLWQMNLAVSTCIVGQPTVKGINTPGAFLTNDSWEWMSFSHASGKYACILHWFPEFLQQDYSPVTQRRNHLRKKGPISGCLPFPVSLYPFPLHFLPLPNKLLALKFLIREPQTLTYSKK